ncbi:MAG TPA: HAD-IB family phosphatase [Candidatus Saccharimonadales bacterium]|nr:HAD-IB family phosphatase [Candidatus Saccharimonadales bacterium]
MPVAPFDPTKPEGFIISNPTHIARKLRAMVAAGPQKIYYLFDFDRTLTTSKYTGSDVTTWHILHGLLPEAGKKQSAAIRSKYLAMEAGGLLSVKDTLAWSSSELKLHGTHGTNIKQLEAAARTIALRDGARTLFTACQTYDIPTVILSAGVSDVIEIIADEHRISPTIILSIKLVTAADGRVIGWQRGSMVHTLNKREKANRRLASLRAERPYTVLIGDTLEDANMADGDDTVLRIRVCDVLKEDEDNPVDYLQQSFRAGYDMVVEGNLEPVVALTHWLHNQP